VADDNFETRETGGPGEDVRERERLIEAFAKAASEHGYRDLTVDQVVRSAGLSRARFEHHFGSKEDGLIAAQGAFLDRIWLDVVGACQTPTDWPQRVRAALQSAISAVVEASSLARVFAVEATAVSLAAAERQFASIDQFASLLGEGRRLYPRAAALPEATERALIGGVFSILSFHLLAENPSAITALESQLVELLLIPYIGEGEARLISAG
jgi:TetR/AcrR family transcriptional regulator